MYTLTAKGSLTSTLARLGTQQTLQCCTIFWGAWNVIRGGMHGHRPTCASLLLSREYPWQAGFV